MTDFKKISEQMIDLGERLSNMVDAANGKSPRATGGMPRWILLPAAGAGMYALARSEFVARQAKEVLDEAKTRASDLPSDLLDGVRHASQKTSSGNGARPSQRQRSESKTTGTGGGQQRRRRSTTAARRKASSG